MGIQNHIKSFVVRSSKISDRIDKIYQAERSKYLIEFPQSPESALIPDEHWSFYDSIGSLNKDELPLIIEIGTGQGDNFAKCAAEDPEHFYVGIEVYEPGIAHTVFLLNKGFESNDFEPVRNAAIIRADVFHLFKQNFFGTGADATDTFEVWIFFPDPWPKKKHHKRRLLDDEFKELIIATFSKQPTIRIATDIEDYAEQISAVFNVNKTERFDRRVLTNFEKKGLAKGREISDYTV
ncbi:MAG: hypothetical protein LBN03_03000 [Bifidobacteriaceae bacterium]|jgi:tRNA (guanine-N7-)-methyltransferase|nr:hypothetical protein [Bifidobacteriaceae bacterium]